VKASTSHGRGSRTDESGVRAVRIVAKRGKSGMSGVMGLRAQYSERGGAVPRRAALAGSAYCWAHDPARLEEREAI
jgi:hypothetical protein